MRFFVAVLALSGSAFGSSIVTNGDFATGDLTGWTSNQNANHGWEIGRSADTVGGSPTPSFASTGCDAGVDVCITGDSSVQNSLSQVLFTNPGDTYTLSFDYNPDVNDRAAEGFAELQVHWGDIIAADLVLGAEQADSQTTALMGFNTYTFTGLLAPAGSTTLTFLGEQDPSFEGLTNVSVVDNSAAPEPGSYLLAAAGLLALAVVRLRARA